MSRSACAWRAGNGTLAAETAGNGLPAPGTSTPHPIAIAPATACLFRRDVLGTAGRLRRNLRLLPRRRRPGSALSARGFHRRLHPRPLSPGITAAQPGDAGARRSFAPYRATRSFSWRATTTRRCFNPVSGPSSRDSFCGAFLRSGMALRSPGLGASGRDCASFIRRAAIPPGCAISSPRPNGRSATARRALLALVFPINQCGRIDTCHVSRSSSLPTIRVRKSAAASMRWPLKPAPATSRRLLVDNASTDATLAKLPPRSPLYS